MARATAWLTSVALVGFAGNSLLCRLALGRRDIDAPDFTAVRLASGALVLALLAGRRARGGSWGSAAALTGYAAAFSFAYLRVPAGVGALVLFAAVQATMIGWGIARGERPQLLEWVGLVVALAGLVILTRPGLQAPDGAGVLLMALAGVCWGAYSLRGRGAADALGTTADNFLKSLPFAAVLAAAGWALDGGHAHVGGRGALLAVASGALASGLGYSLWYAALGGLTPTTAAIVQLAAPVLAAAGGVVLLGETASLRLVVAGAAILGGIGLALAGHKVRAFPRSAGGR